MKTVEIGHWRTTLAAVAVAGATLLLAAGCGTTVEPPKTATQDAVAVSSPYLEVAIREMLGRDVRMVRLAGPTMCPGHFDMRPSLIRDLANCPLLVRFDFQAALDEKIGRGSNNRRQVVSVHVPSGLCVPESYLTACRQIADHFVAAGSLTRPQADERLERLGVRMAHLKKGVVPSVDQVKLRDAPVLASKHQADFCRWLGLRVVADISASDTTGVSEIEKAIKNGQTAGVRLIVANEPEGRQSADALADRLHAQVVVFANFPAPDVELPFDAMVRHNVAALIDAAKTAAGPP
jgi:zinc transport system substrate-binding protein